MYRVAPSKVKIAGWPNGVPSVVDEARNELCICRTTHGMAIAMHIASALNDQAIKMKEDTDGRTSGRSHPEA